MTHESTTGLELHTREVEDAFSDRFDMLEESGQITALARWMTVNALARIAQDFGLTLTEDNASQFATHVAMAFSRLQRGEEEAPLSEALRDEVREHPREREVVRQIMGEAEPVLDRDVPDSEIDYMTVHLCALVAEQ